MCTRVHFPTMHSHMGFSLLHNPPILLLKEQKEKKDQLYKARRGCDLLFNVCPRTTFTLSRMFHSTLNDKFTNSTFHMTRLEATVECADNVH